MRIRFFPARVVIQRFWGERSESQAFACDALLRICFLGLYYQNRPADREEYEEITDGKKISPSLRVVYSELNQHGAKIWSSNGPICVPDAFRDWLSEFRDTYSLLCEVIDVMIPGTAIAQIRENHLQVPKTIDDPRVVAVQLE